MRHRIFILLLSITLILSVFMVRLLWLQTFATHVPQSVLQRGQSIVLDDGRADFYDRHMTALTGQTVSALAIFPLHEAERAGEEQLAAVANILDVEFESFVDYLNQLQSPVLWAKRLDDTQITALKDIDVPGLTVVPTKVRYEPPFVAAHLLGFVSQHPERIKQHYEKKLQNGTVALDSVIGASGLELSLDEMLHGVEPTTLTLYTDAQHRLLQGLQMRMQRPQRHKYPLKAVLTIDKHMQQRIEALFDTLNVREGAVVVLDASNADVVAMASRPQFQPNDVHLAEKNWANKALQAVAPGSIFKTVVAAAALEGRYVTPHEIFQCNGSYGHRSLGTYRLRCWHKAGHGALTFEQAFAASCNVTFAEVMERIPSHELQYVAAKLGVGQAVGWEKEIKQFYGEEVGQLFASGTRQDDAGVRAQTAIGQRDVMMTPLQAANLVVTLLHDGEVKRPRVVQSLRYSNDKMMRSFPRQKLVERHKGISAKTTRTLRHWMEETVAFGTGQMLKQATWQLAGKSGTAEQDSGSYRTLNQWFIGYGPVQSPRYAVAVLVQGKEHELGDSHRATAMFREIMNTLAETSV